jgi:hypothetical protein
LGARLTGIKTSGYGASLEEVKAAFLAALEGYKAWLVWPLAARAQQAAMPVIGLLDQRSPEELADRLRGFRQGLKDVGFVSLNSGYVPFRLLRRRIPVACAAGNRAKLESG